jgi:hypothetical protein
MMAEPVFQFLDAANIDGGREWRFRGIVRGGGRAKLDGWLDDARHTGLYGIRRLLHVSLMGHRSRGRCHQRDMEQRAN